MEAHELGKWEKVVDFEAQPRPCSSQPTALTPQRQTMARIWAITLTLFGWQAMATIWATASAGAESPGGKHHITLDEFREWVMTRPQP